MEVVDFDIQKRGCANILIKQFFLCLKKSISKMNVSICRKKRDSISKKLFDVLNIHIGNDALLPLCVKCFLMIDDNYIRIRHMHLRAKRKFKRFISMSEKRIPSNFIDLLMMSSDKQLDYFVRELVSVKHYEFIQTLQDINEFSQVNGSKCVLFNEVFPPMWSSLLNSLKRQRWTVATFLRTNLEKSDSYATLNTENIPAQYRFQGDLFCALLFMHTLDDCSFLLSGEAYHHVNFDAENAIILYAIMEAVAQSAQICKEQIRSQLFFLMYDGLKPVMKNTQGMNGMLSAFFRVYIQSVDRIIYNSNSKLFSISIENIYNIKNSCIHFLRYSEQPTMPMPRLEFGENLDQFHMACITSCLNSDLDASRNESTTNVIRSIIQQGIHFHYYGGEGGALVKTFLDNLDEKYHKYFHVHPTIFDQLELVNELHQYHFVFNPSDYLLISKEVTEMCEDRRYQDAMKRFIQSSYPTSNFLAVAAGVPVITASDSENLFCDTMFFLTYSELKNLKAILKKMNLPELCKRADKNSSKAWIDNYIHELIDFISMTDSDYASNQNYNKYQVIL